MVELEINIKSPDKIQKLVQIATSYDYDIELAYGRYTVDAKSIIGVFTLNIGHPINMVVHSEECGGLIDKLKENDYF